MTHENVPNFIAVSSFGYIDTSLLGRISPYSGSAGASSYHASGSRLIAFLLTSQIHQLPSKIPPPQNNNEQDLSPAFSFAVLPDYPKIRSSRRLTRLKPHLTP